MGHFRRIRIIHSEDILLNWLAALAIKDSELDIVAKQAGRNTPIGSTLQSLARRSRTGKRLGIGGCQHTTLAVDIADRAGESAIHADLNVSCGGLGDTRKHAGLHELAVDVDIHVALEDRDGDREPRLKRHILHRACEDIARRRPARIRRSRFTGGCRGIPRMDGNADIQCVLIRGQRDFGSLDARICGVSATQDDLLLTVAVVPITNLAPELKTLINHSCRNLGARDRIGLFAVQRGCRQVLDHGGGNLLGGTTCDHQLNHESQQHQDQEVKPVGSPRSPRCRIGCWSKSRKPLHL